MINKMKRKIIFISVALITISLFLVLIFLKKRESVNFVRIKFRSLYTTERVDQSEKIPGFIRIKYQEGDKIHIDPGLDGEKGILLNLRVLKDKGSGGGITTSILRGGNVVFTRSAEFTKSEFFYYLSQKFHFQKNDKFEISFSGSGKAIVRDPVFYSIIEPDERQYVFVIALDNLRFDRIGRRVNGVDLTPNLISFIKDSVSFINGYSQSSWTLPAFTSFFTGLNEFNHGITRESVLSEEIPLLTESLSKKFITISINGGVWLGSKITNRRGFDLFSLGSLTKDVNASEVFFNNTIKFLEENELPSLFMFMHTFAIHAPYHPPERFLYEIEKDPKYKSLPAFAREEQFLKGVSEEERSARELLYDADVKAFDYYFGKFVEYLKGKKIYDQSLIVFLSDHGEEFFEHGGWFHGHSLYDEMIRIPIIIKLPGNRSGGAVLNGNSGIIDILPTLAEINDIKLPEGIDGISLLPMINGKKDNDRLLFSSATVCKINRRNPEMVSIINKNFKFIYNIPGTGRESIWEVFRDRGVEELYDLNKDPGEINNIVKENPVLVKKFKRELIKILKQIKESSSKKKVKRNQIDEKDKENLKTLGYL